MRNHRIDVETIYRS